ncbi:MAG: MFS transporter [Betaproteobacteria bacterium]|nr:MFS transporter [Betaproteobacteria bacterium]PWB59983.1 MAG: glycerol acyltransferase [Betaproteobacteria bacterium]
MSSRSQFALLAERRFAPLFWTQFLGAANDNLFKFAFTLLATYQSAAWGGVDPSTAGFVIGAIFIAPFVLLSATAGQLADKIERGRLIRFVKDFEIAVMAIAAAGFAAQVPPLLYASVFLMGVHSTLFGPVKYAYLPQHLDGTELTGGNGMVEMGTFVAILLGTMAAGFLVKGQSGPAGVAAGCLAVAALGRVAAGFVPLSPAPDPGLAINWNPFTETWRNLRIAARDAAVFHALLGISWLWFVGSIFLTSFTPFTREVLHGDENVVTVLLAVFSAGIGLGALACERLSGRKVEIGLVPFGSIGITVFAVDLWLACRGLAPDTIRATSTLLREWETVRVMADLFLLSLFAGFYSVPLYALIQSRGEAGHRARIIAANNILNALFMIVASLTATALLRAGLTLPQLFLVVGIMNAAVAAYIYLLVPEFLMRFLCWLLIHSAYRLRKEGIGNIPEEGAAVVVCNHVSFVDALVILAASPRPIRFVMDHRIFRVPVLSFVFRTGKAIPIAPAREDPALLEKAYDEVAAALAQGELVGIFPEGRITEDGEIQRFRTGLSRILERTPVPVVPMALQGLYGSFFSRRGGAAMSKPFRRGVFSRIGLQVAPAVAPTLATPESMHRKVLELRGDWR